MARFRRRRTVTRTRRPKQSGYLLYDVADLEEQESGELIPRLRDSQIVDDLESKIDYSHASLIVSRTNYTFGFENKQDRESYLARMRRDPSDLISYTGRNFAVILKTAPKIKQTFYYTVYLEDFHDANEAYRAAERLAKYLCRRVRFFFTWNFPFTITDYVFNNIDRDVTNFYRALVYKSKTK